MLEDYTELLYVNVSYEVLALTLILRQMCANAHFGAQISWPHFERDRPQSSRQGPLYLARFGSISLLSILTGLAQPSYFLSQSQRSAYGQEIRSSNRPDILQQPHTVSPSYIIYLHRQVPSSLRFHILPLSRPVPRH